MRSQGIGIDSIFEKIEDMVILKYNKYSSSKPFCRLKIKFMELLK